MNIGLDFHGVIADGAARKAAVLKQRYGIDVHPDICHRAHLVKEGYVSEATYEDVADRIFEQAGEHALIPPVPGALRGIKRLQAAGHQLRIVTACGEEVERHVAAWLARHAIDLPLICVGRHGNKTDACGDLRAYVDDNLAQLLAIKRHGLTKHLFGPQPDERPKLWRYGIRRLHTWDQLLALYARHARVA